MHKKISLTALAVLVVLSVLGNVYLYTKTEKLDYDIIIGTPVKGENGDIGNNFSNSKPLSDKDEFNSLVFYLMDATSIDKPKICENLPDSIITFNDWKDGTQYYNVNVWIDGNSLIIGTTGEQPKYKIIENIRAQEILKIIQKYTVKTDT